MSKTLQEITDAWGKWMNEQHPGDGIKFTESTNYQNWGELNQYHQYETNATYQSMTYDPNAPTPIPGTANSVVTSYENGSSVQQSYTYTQTLTTTQSFTWSITESLSVGREISVGINIPEVAKIGSKITVTLGLSSTQGAISSETQSWSVTQPIAAPPGRHIDAKMVVTTQQYKIKWKASCMLSGYVAIWFHSKVALNPGNFHWLWFIPISQVFAQCQLNKLIDTTGYQIVADGVIAYSEGEFNGNQGVGVCIKITEKPLSITDTLVSEIECIKTYSIPITKTGTSALIMGEV